jgi:hypothetical protein
VQRAGGATEREVSPQLGLLKALLQLDSTFSERNYAGSFRDFVEKLAATACDRVSRQGRMAGRAGGCRGHARDDRWRDRGRHSQPRPMAAASTAPAAALGTQQDGIRRFASCSARGNPALAHVSAP